MPSPRFSSIRELLPRSKSKLFGQVDVYPNKVHFANQNPGEEIFILIRKHVITNFGWIWRSVFFIFLPLLILWGLNFLISAFPQADIQLDKLSAYIPLISWLILGMIYYSSIVTYMFVHFLDWYFDIYLVTSERFVHSEFKLLTGKFVSEAPLKNIQDVKQHVIGVFPSIFNYGDVFVSTAAERGRFIFDSVPDPTWFRDVITDLAKLVSGNEP